MLHVPLAQIAHVHCQPSNQVALCPCPRLAGSWIDIRQAGMFEAYIAFLKSKFCEHLNETKFESFRSLSNEVPSLVLIIMRKIIELKFL